MRIGGDEKLISVRLAPGVPQVAALQRFLETVSGAARLNSAVGPVWNADALSFLEIMERISLGRIARPLPGIGPVPAGRNAVIVANHPVGGLDIVALLTIMEASGRNYRILAHKSIIAPPSLASRLIPVDPTRRHAPENLAAAREIMAEFGRGFDTLVLFPAGYCARFQFADWSIADPPWQSSFARIAQRSNAMIVPISISGRNSWLFYAAALVFGKLAAVLLPWEFTSSKGRIVRAEVGEALEVPAALTRSQLADFVVELRHTVEFRVVDIRNCGPATKPPNRP